MQHQQARLTIKTSSRTAQLVNQHGGTICQEKVQNAKQQARFLLVLHFERQQHDGEFFNERDGNKDVNPSWSKYAHTTMYKKW